MSLMPIIRPPGLVPAGGGGAATLLEDTFNGAGVATELTSWTPTGTGSWVADPDDTSIRDWNVETDGDINPSGNNNDNRLGRNSGTSPTSANQRATVQIGFWGTNETIDKAIQVRLRIGASGESYAFLLWREAGVAMAALEYQDSDTSVSATLDTATDGAILGGEEYIFTVNGSSLEVTRDDGGGHSTIMSATDSNITAAGEVGIGMGYGSTTRDVIQNRQQPTYVKFEDGI